MNKHIKMVTILTAAGLLLNSTPALTGHTHAAQTHSSAAAVSSLKKIDAKLLTEAQNSLKEVTGKSYSFSKAEKWSTGNDTGWTLTIKGVKNGYVNIVNNKVDTIQLEQKWADLQNTYKQTLKSVLKELNVETLPDSVSLYKYAGSGKLEMFASVNNHYITLLDGEIKRVMSTMPLESVSQDMLDAANAAVESFNGISLGKLTKAAYVKGQDSNHVELQFEGDSPKTPVFINIEEGAHRITKIEVTSLQDSVTEFTKGYNKLISYSENKLLQAAIPVAKGVLNLDLSDYKISKDKDRPGVVQFTKKNAPSVNGMYNSKGQFYLFETE